MGPEFRCLTSLFTHAGIEWDLTAAGAGELKFLASWTALYRELRPLLHGGRVVGGDDDLTGALVHGVVAPDRSEALHAVVRLTSAAAAGFGGVRLPGFDLARRYRLRVRGDFLRPTRADAVPAWWAAASAGGVELSGTVLADVGLQLPVLGVAQGVPPALDALTAQCRRQPTGTAPATSGSSVRSGSSASRRANR